MRRVRKIGRSAITGRFTTVKKARRFYKTHVVETVRSPKKRRRR